jgi:hypothetical protein
MMVAVRRGGAGVHGEETTMKIAIFCTTALLLACSLSARADVTREQTFVVGADVNAQGVVTQTQPEASVSKPIAAVLDLALKRWQFVPAQEGGKAVPVHTFIETKLEAIPDDSGKYSLRISYVRHGPKWDRQLSPRYPEEAARNRESGVIVVKGELQADDKIVVTDTLGVLEGGNGGSRLKRAARDWFLHHNAVPETVDGRPVAARISTWITFRLGEPGSSPQKPWENVPYSAKEKELLHQAGFKDSDFNTNVGSPMISSVLRARMVNPVTMHL